ncbi:MAG: hypothetical protein CVU77_05480 [Elusimicrobia bacterium HGW-Elusimicrobia-1]|jgi:Do/DeqQ family serine protease|nr:MAG: hypothetical protein CVU77_05480 [Elusimicrobia bacterium HGW-Elusimicrobia-1]
MSAKKAYLFSLLALLLALVFSFTSGRRRFDCGAPAYQTSGVVASSEAVNLEDAFIRVAADVKPAVVNISTVHIEKIQSPRYEFFFGSPFDGFFEEFFGAPRRSQSPPPRGRPQTRRQEGTGSGVIISPDGYILTNEHVVREADEINVAMAHADGSEKKYKGKVVGKDTRTDLAVIKISGSRLPYARLGDSDKIRVGQWVVAIGSPFGLEQTVTTGIVSAKRQALSIEGRTYRDLIQTDAAINRGNSGGPLCDIYGEVIGVNTAIYAPTGVFSGIGFAVPINRAKAILDELIKTGKVTRGWLGVEIRAVDAAIEKNFKLSSRDGAFVANVLDGSPAAASGLKRGDVIVDFDGKKVKIPMDLQDAVSASAPSKKVAVAVVRDGKRLNLNVVLAAMPDEPSAAVSSPSDAPAASSYKWEGMSVSDITDALRAEFAVASDVKGVIVVDVEDYSAADRVGIAAGDVVKSLNNTGISSVADFKKVSARADIAKGVVFDVSRAGRSIYLTYSEE